MHSNVYLTDATATQLKKAIRRKKTDRRNSNKAAAEGGEREKGRECKNWRCPFEVREAISMTVKTSEATIKN